MNNLRDNIFAFIICCCSIIATGLYAFQFAGMQRVTLEKHIDKRIENGTAAVATQAAQAKKEAATAVVQAQHAATKVRSLELRECDARISRTDAHVSDLTREVVELRKEVRILEGR
jgi:hypothetical protein